MPELTSEQIAKIDRGMDTVIKLETVLLGADGDRGLVGKVEDACNKTVQLEGKVDLIDNRLVRVEVRSGIIAGLISVAAAVTSWFASR